ncbi:MULTISPECIES: cadherin-like beta sandwich domain-containing protein [Brucella/Ochrobactrum group]|nr:MULTISPECIES: cadherin-like beta sandwich domain-containing protein [Brucella]MDX4076260.1 cadherin-like beta sandwich domain-containing protein [Brucella sp. NBRC 113783]RRD24049.1 autotransporter domain-containing protein [Brucellaceae bacterium VT-16-1752]WHS33662.1 cadherin-like beta sandwich domain-containing protein [Brucella sp. NM4]
MRGAPGWRYLCAMIVGLFALISGSLAAQSAPTAAPIEHVIFSNGSIVGWIGATVGGTLTYSLASNPMHGIITNFFPETGIFTYTPAPNFSGVDTFTYQVTDDTGSASNTVTITVLGQNPTVMSVTVPRSGYYKAGDKLNFVVNFDDLFSVIGNPVIPIVIGTTLRNAIYTPTPGNVSSNSLTFSYTIQPGDIDANGISIGPAIVLNGGTIETNAGQPADLTLNNVGATNGVLVNTANPTVVLSTSSPASSEEKIITITFSEAVSGLDQNDFEISTTGLHDITYRLDSSVNNIVYTLRMRVQSSESVQIQLPENAAVSFFGNKNLASNILDISVVKSSDANLQNLIPSTGTLTPTFAPNTSSYTLNVANDVESISFTPSLADINATAVVNGASTPNGTSSASIPLVVGSNTVTTTVTAQDGTTTKSYTVNVIRAQSGNAELVGLVPSAGSLDPAFSPSATTYALAVPTETSSLQLTPTAADPTATITVNGAAVASGSASSAFPLGIGNTTLTVVVIAQNGTTRSYMVNVTRAVSADATLASLVPSVGSLDPAFDKETLSYSVNVENGVESISFVPTVSEPSARVSVAGSNVASGSSSAPVGLGVGANTVSIVVTAPSGANRSYTVVVSRAVPVFPDPTLDPEVIGLLNAQTSAARRFAQVQTRNFQNRLEQLHDEGDRRKSSLGVRLGGQASNAASVDPSDRSSSASATPNAALGYAPEKRNAFPGKVIGLKDPEQPAPALDPDLGPFAFWSSGFVNFGERDSGKLDLDYTLVGVSGGIDYRFSERFVAGFGVGYGRDRTDIGDNGTESRANAYSAAFYGSFKPLDNFFIDALVGGSILDFDSIRFITTDGSLTDGKRDGSQMFGSLTAAYEFRQETWLVSPYGRLEMSRSWLDGYAESGDSIYRLTYGDQTVDTVTGVVGLRANYAIDYTWGRLTPGVRAEYAHDFQGASRTAMGYSALGGLPYALDIEGESSDSGNVGLSLDFSFENAWTTGVEYQTGFGGSGARDHAFALRVGAKF